jgi:SAM-dependent methyltransferase
MELQEYITMFESEDTHWWYRGLHELVARYTSQQIREKGSIRLLDAGCGTGGALEFLGIDDSWGMDFSADAIKLCQSRNLTGLARASLESIPFVDNNFDIVISLDVLYHRCVQDDLAALKELHRVLVPGGLLLLNLPAYDFLRSSHDEAIHTGRRFTRAKLDKNLKICGFEKRKVYYRNSLLMPLAAAVRLCRKGINRKSPRLISDVEENNSFLNSLFLEIMRAENRFHSAGFSLPFGLSVFAVSQKN